MNCVTESTESTELCAATSVHRGVKWAIDNTRPSEADCIWRKIWDFARELKALQELTHAESSKLTQYVQAWHNSLPSCIKNWYFEDTEEEFEKAWEKVKYAARDGLVEHAFAIAVNSPPPPCADRFEGKEIKVLILFCRELQRLSGDKPFFLSCRIAAKLLKVSHTTTARWLRILVRNKILEIVILGGPETNKATRYLYLPKD